MDRKGIIGVTICVLLLLIWYPLMHRLGWLPQGTRNVPRPETSVSGTSRQPGEERPPRQDAVAESGKVVDAAGVKPDVGGKSPGRAGATVSSGKQAGAAAPAEGEAEASGLFVPRAQSGRRAALSDGKHLGVDIDLDYGGAVEVRLLQFEDDRGVRPHRIGSPRAPTGTVFPESPLSLGRARVVRRDTRAVVLERELGGTGLKLVEEWRLTDTPYEMEYRVSWRNESSTKLTVPGCFLPAGAVSLPAKGKKGGRGAGRLVMFLPEVDVLPVGARRSVMFSLKRIARTSLLDLRRFRRRPCQWVAVHSKYFVFGVRSASEAPLPGFFMAMIPPEKDSGLEEGGLLTGGVVLPRTALAPGDELQEAFRFYMGPKELKRVEAWAPAFTDVMRLDRFMFGLRPAWMGWMAKTLLRALIAVDRLVDTSWGFGWAIVVVTFVIKLLFWPLTHRSTVSMRKMQKIQPLIQEIREKYKSDPQKMNRKIMETYKEHNVSPFGGCLPLLLQIPVFFALFNVLRGSIELRHAHFLWVSDLSLPDTVAVLFGIPIRPFALLMAGSMFVQQRLSPTSPDPSQARMMTFMTIFFAFLFYSMPAGLTLYWTTNQLLTIVQMAVTNRLLGLDRPAGGASGRTGTKESGRQ